ncbi:MAG: protein kinase domain-containing protein, partial [Acidobacteriota bacterium]
MLCFRCGSPVEDSAKTCKNCGQDLTGSSSSPDAEQFSEIQKKLRQTGREWTRPASYKVGEVVNDRYEIKSVVGNGATGLVYKAFDQEVEVDVALKVIGSEFLPDEDARREFMKRIAPARELIHDNVVRTFELDREGDHCFAVMQFLEGLTLRKVIKLRRDKGQRFALTEVEPIAA